MDAIPRTTATTLHVVAELIRARSLQRPVDVVGLIHEAAEMPDDDDSPRPEKTQAREHADAVIAELAHQVGFRSNGPARDLRLWGRLRTSGEILAELDEAADALRSGSLR